MNIPDENISKNQAKKKNNLDEINKGIELDEGGWEEEKDIEVKFLEEISYESHKSDENNEIDIQQETEVIEKPRNKNIERNEVVEKALDDFF